MQDSSACRRTSSGAAKPPATPIKSRQAAETDRGGRRSSAAGQEHRRIDEQLGDPSLSVGSLATELGVSESQLHRLFKTEPVTVSRYIWERRLDACSRDLLEPRLAGQPLAEIAYGRGFNDAAHFSRAFRDRFGCSPREWRRQEQGLH